MANVERKTWKIFGKVLRDTSNFIAEGITVDAAAVDPGTDQPGALRPGLVMARKASTGKYLPYGVNFKNGSEAKDGDGTTTVFELAHGHIVPFSEVVKVGNVVKKRDIDYVIDYKRGVVTFFTAPGPGTNNVTFTYLYDDTLDGTEIPVGILMDYVYVDSCDGPKDTNATLLISGLVDEAQIKVIKEGSLDFAKHILALYGFFGIRDPAVSL
jgi:hypothetical protein